MAEWTVSDERTNSACLNTAVERSVPRMAEPDDARKHVADLQSAITKAVDDGRRRGARRSHLPMSGWMRSLRKVQKLELTADVRFDNFTEKEDVRPVVRIHFLDLEQPIELSVSKLPNQKARVADFITHLRKMMATGAE